MYIYHTDDICMYIYMRASKEDIVGNGQGIVEEGGSTRWQRWHARFGDPSMTYSQLYRAGWGDACT